MALMRRRYFESSPLCTNYASHSNPVIMIGGRCTTKTRVIEDGRCKHNCASRWYRMNLYIMYTWREAYDVRCTCLRLAGRLTKRPMVQTSKVST